MTEAPTTVTLLQEAERVFLGQTDDFVLSAPVQDVFNAMRVAGLVLLAFCTVISLAEQTEAGITGNGSGLIGWFKRFFVATLMTFGGLQVYGLWIRLFNGLLAGFRHYLDTHWLGGGDTGVLYLQIIHLMRNENLLLTMALGALTVIVLLLLWFMVGGVRQAELILSIVIAPVVWPLYLIQSVEDIPKTAFRGFLGLNAVLLFTVAMVRMAVRLAIGAGGAVSIWNLVPAIAMLVMTIFLPAIIKRIVGQGQSGVGALMTAVQLAAGLKFLSLAGLGAGGAAAAPAAAAIPKAPAGASAYPLASVPSGGVAGAAADPPRRATVSAPMALHQGAMAYRPMQLEGPLAAGDMCIEMGESMPGTGRFDQVKAVERFRQGMQSFRQPQQQDQGGDRT